ncbi:MAG: peroxiredoxin [Bacteroidales bacterium]
MKPYFMLLTLVAFLGRIFGGEPLQVGDRVPDFVLKDQNGNEFRLKDHLGKSCLVIYFYPKDDTPGCTKQACYFRDQYEAFTSAGAQVIGISSQDEASHKAFAQKYKLPFTLLADVEGKVRKQFGAGSGVIPGRVTFVVDKEGKVAYVFSSQTDVQRHVDEALKVVKQLNGR